MNGWLGIWTCREGLLLLLASWGYCGVILVPS